MKKRTLAVLILTVMVLTVVIYSVSSATNDNSNAKNLHLESIKGKVIQIVGEDENGKIGIIDFDVEKAENDKRAAPISEYQIQFLSQYGLKEETVANWDNGAFEDFMNTQPITNEVAVFLSKTYDVPMVEILTWTQLEATNFMEEKLSPVLKQEEKEFQEFLKSEKMQNILEKFNALNMSMDEVKTLLHKSYTYDEISEMTIPVLKSLLESYNGK